MLEVYNHQEAIGLEDDLLERIQFAGCKAIALVLEAPMNDGGVLDSLELVEVSLVDDETSARVHQEFMAIPGATDVITFAHGEIVVGVEEAQRNAAEYEVDFEEELIRYVVHGLLHLRGWEDEVEDERTAMLEVQEDILGRLGLGSANSH